MALAEDLKKEAKEVFATAWATREGLVVPEAVNVKLGNDAVHFKRATVLYADLHGSTNMVDSKLWYFSAEVYKAFLSASAKIIKSEDGVITAYDGDRAMAVFIGKTQTTDAVRCALKINYAVCNIIQPALQSQYKTDFKINHCVGIDSTELRVVRTGVRGSNDLVFVGRAANYAAKLTELDLGPKTWVTKAAYDQMMDAVKKAGDPKRDMWEKRKWSQMNDHEVYGSTWWWQIS